MSPELPELAAEEAEEMVKLYGDELLPEQFRGDPPGLTELDDDTFYALFLMRQAEYGPDFARALDAKKPDGTDLIPGGRNTLRKFLRIRAKRQMAAMAMWNPELEE